MEVHALPTNLHDVQSPFARACNVMRPSYLTQGKSITTFAQTVDRMQSRYASSRYHDN